ncbi:Oxidoreductase AflY [Fusarium oxysporum f. sp. albedinis]|nr:Oxidoreductase AflY [Fusarium oxysporum f. sp. albedinis]
MFQLFSHLAFAACQSVRGTPMFAQTRLFLSLTRRTHNSYWNRLLQEYFGNASIRAGDISYKEILTHSKDCLNFFNKIILKLPNVNQRSTMALASRLLAVITNTKHPSMFSFQKQFTIE